MGLELRLTAWQNHEFVELLTRRPVSIVAGPNASGKTALVDGVEFVFLGTGKLRGIATKTDLAALSIHDDYTSTTVDLRIPEIGFELCRGMEPGGSQDVTVGGIAYKVTKADAKIREKLGIEPERVRAALDADHVLSGDEAKRRWIFFKATGTSATLAELLDPLKEAGLDHDNARKIADEILADGFPAGLAIAKAKRLTAGQKSQSATATTPEAVFSPSWAPEGEGIRLDEIALDELLEREKKLESDVSAADVSAGVDRGRLEAELSSAKGQRSKLFAERERAQNAPESDETADATLAEATLALKTLEIEIGNIRPKLTRMQAEKDAIISGKVEKPERCPAIAGAPECPMSKTKLAAHRKTLDVRVSELSTLIANERTSLKRLEGRRSEAQTAKDAALSDVDDKTARENRLEELIDEIETAEAKVTAADAKVREAAEPEGDVAALAESIRERLENLRQVLGAKRRYDAAAEAAHAAAGTRRDAETERAVWDRVVKLLAPDGLPSRLFAARAAELQAYIDEIGLSCPVRLTPSAELEAEIGGRWRKRAQLSESWRIRIAIAASHALARAAGFPILLVDRFDHFDPEGRVNVLEGLRRVAPLYPGGVLVLSTLSRPDPKPTGLSDVETFIFGDDGLSSIG